MAGNWGWEEVLEQWNDGVRTVLCGDIWMRRRWITTLLDLNAFFLRAAISIGNTYKMYSRLIIY